MIIAANASVGRTWAGHAAGILTGLLAGSLFLFGAIDYAGAGSGDHNPAGVDIGIMVTAIGAAAVASRPVREWAARTLSIDPANPVHSLALALAVILLGTQVSSIAFTDVFASELKAPALSIPDLFWQEVPFLVLALAGVGLWVRRGLVQSGSRLGVAVPAWWQMALALSAAGAFFAISLGGDRLSHVLTPSIAAEVDKTTAHLFGAISNDPIGLVALAVLPGICEEALFRGALQPRLGVLLTALLFTAIHTEYGLSIDVPTIFLIAVGLGLIRKYTNTTTSATTHVSYNLLVGFNLTGAVLAGAAAVEVLLIVAVAYALWTRRRRVGVANAVVQETGVR
jgi:CAAX protease family protein